MQVKEQQRCNGPEVEVRSAKLSNGKEATESEAANRRRRGRQTMQATLDLEVRSQHRVLRREVT